MLIKDQLKLIKEKEDISEAFLDSNHVDTDFLNTEKKRVVKASKTNINRGY